MFNVVIFVATKNGRTTNFFSPTMKTNVLAFFPNSDPYLLGISSPENSDPDEKVLDPVNR